MTAARHKTSGDNDGAVLQFRVERASFWFRFAAVLVPMGLFALGVPASAQSPADFSANLNPLFLTNLTQPSDLNNTLQYAANASADDIDLEAVSDRKHGRRRDEACVLFGVAHIDDRARCGNYRLACLGGRRCRAIGQSDRSCQQNDQKEEGGLSHRDFQYRAWRAI